MVITLTNCASTLQPQGIDLTDNNTVSQKISSLLSWLSWDYNFERDELSITVQDGTVLPDLSSIGRVVIT